jgi:hypothetical protein
MYVRASFCVSNVGTMVSSSVIGVALGVEASCGVCAVAIGPTSVRQQKAKTLGHLITLTSIFSQRKSRPLLLLGEGRDEGFDPVKIDNLIHGLRKFSPMKLKIIGKNVRQSAKSADNSMALQKAMHFFGQFWSDPFGRRDLLDARFAQAIDRTEFSQEQILSVLTHTRAIVENTLVDSFLEQKLMIRVGEAMRFVTDSLK